MDGGRGEPTLVVLVELPHRATLLEGQRVAASGARGVRVLVQVRHRPALDHLADLGTPVPRRHVRATQRAVRRQRVTGLVEGHPGLGLVDRDADAPPGEQGARPLVHAGELDPVDHVGRQQGELVGEHVRQGPHQGRHQDRARAAAREVRGAVQPDEGLARAGRAADPAGPVERPAHERRLRRVQEGHPVLDRRGEAARHERVGDLPLAEHRTGSAPVARHRDARPVRPVRADRRRLQRGAHREHAGEHDLDLPWRQPRAVGRDEPQHVLLPHDADRADPVVHVLASGEHEHRPDLARGQADLDQVTLGAVGDVGEREHVVGDVLVATQHDVALDPDVAGGVGVDHEHAALTHHHQPGVLPASAPARRGRVDEQVVPDRGQRGERVRRDDPRGPVARGRDAASRREGPRHGVGVLAHLGEGLGGGRSGRHRGLGLRCARGRRAGTARREVLGPGEALARHEPFGPCEVVPCHAALPSQGVSARGRPCLIRPPG